MQEQALITHTIIKNFIKNTDKSLELFSELMQKSNFK